MLPGNSNIYQCPQCLHRFEIEEAGSGYVSYQEVWSDGYIFGGDVPPEIFRCGHCQEMHWLKHLDPVYVGKLPDGYGMSKINFDRSTSNSEKKVSAPMPEPPAQTPRLAPKKHWVPVRIPINGSLEEVVREFPVTDIQYLRLEDYLIAIQCQFWETREDEIKIRMLFWHHLNHSLRPDVLSKKTKDENPLSKEKWLAYNENGERLLSILPKFHSNQRPLLRAEILRNLSRFTEAMEEAEQTASSQKWNFSNKERELFIHHCKNENPYPYLDESRSNSWKTGEKQ